MKRSDVSYELKRLNTYFRACNILTGSDHLILESAANMLTTAHWERDNEGDYHCSNCKAIVESDERARHYWRFCYHCGAEMKFGCD